MPFIPHTESEIAEMLEVIGADSIEQLFDEIPPALRHDRLEHVPEGMSEQAVTGLMLARARQNQPLTCFAGAGAYAHFIPAAVWELTTRGEFYSAYTPYQAEASQGTLQLIYEYQTMMSSLQALDVSNASLYDGATAVAEAILMAVRANRKVKARRVLVAGSLHPHYLEVVNTMVVGQGISVDVLPFDTDTGTVQVPTAAPDPFVALVLPQPNFFGNLEAVDALTDWAHAQNALVIGVVNPVAMAVIAPPGEWGEKGADIACGDGQPLGIPLSGGGPYYGFLCAKKALVRQMPGRIVGKTVDLDGKEGFVLTLQAREQHIRRSKATSNICTNQGLMVTASTIFMAIKGEAGLRGMAVRSMTQTRKLVDALTSLPGVQRRYPDASVFHECVLTLPCPAEAVVRALAADRILAGVALGGYFDGYDNALLVCATEVISDEDIDVYRAALNRALQAPSAA